ncbi:hypothetical protein G6F57_018753 [Rhizopus arrhizus]|nr:hypothetical protein G6F57_018753 [Rhizopus arrhizus]
MEPVGCAMGIGGGGGAAVVGPVTMGSGGIMAQPAASIASAAANTRRRTDMGITARCVVIMLTSSSATFTLDVST